jgi:small subunit ribosomal protein S17
MISTERIGVVISNKMEKTVVVKIESRYSHSLYSKTLTKTLKYLAHDENNSANIGDLVLVKICRPLSKRKHWSLTKVLAKSLIH